MRVFNALFTIVALVSVILMSAGCYSANHQNEHVFSPHTVLANKDVLLNQSITVRGTATVGLRVLCTLMACSADNPCCNTCGGDLQLCEAGSCITLSGDEANIQVGCSGNECGLTCYPFQQGTAQQIFGVWRKRASEEYVLELRSLSQRAVVVF